MTVTSEGGGEWHDVLVETELLRKGSLGEEQGVGSTADIKHTPSWQEKPG